MISNNTLFPSTKKILIIGDVILDVYHFGRVDRVSPEAPVPVVQVTRSINRLGGAGNVANNISSLGKEAVLLGYLGKDYNNQHVKELLKNSHIDYNLVDTQHPTITKMRVVSGVQQIVRVDFEEIYTINDEVERNQRTFIDKNIDAYDTIILSDYGKGAITNKLSEYIIDKANKHNKVIIVDPKGTDWEKYRNATMITPNVKELGDVVGYKIANEDDSIVRVGREVLKKYDIKYLLVTRSEKGMTFFDTDTIHHIRTHATEVFDVSGAGDTVVATLATAISSGYEWIEAVKLANKAAGIVVSKIGTEPITYKELENTIYEFKEDKKLVSQETIESLSASLHEDGRKIVFTNGCFDIIHKGHIKYLQAAKKLGDILIVGLNSDSSIKRLKGPERPIKAEDERALILCSLEFIDYVVIFDEDTPFLTIKKIHPDILVKGGDYKVENVIGKEFAKETILIPFVDGYSTTSTINKMKE